MPKLKDGYGGLAAWLRQYAADRGVSVSFERGATRIFALTFGKLSGAWSGLDTGKLLHECVHGHPAVSVTLASHDGKLSNTG